MAYHSALGSETTEEHVTFQKKERNYYIKHAGQRIHTLQIT